MSIAAASHRAAGLTGREAGVSLSAIRELERGKMLKKKRTPIFRHPCIDSRRRWTQDTPASAAAQAIFGRGRAAALCNVRSLREKRHRFLSS
ncbi:hypothetical protein R1flu_004703 [Riccia fluitans]|uniref:Uncharacterized protein n=1 Tax=Riccia fluitans TaxID=41844 RepID=A0ABD1YS17_9MARC